ncbi:uncharacterized protein LOC136078644 [Hydra vulgaris]|uniref:Uncharacterized protein LOC136078644 n=1 Tax=Hydra vulgaris TaxID=6087 RepID=A0ABM4BN43_HYDVU
MSFNVTKFCYAAGQYDHLSAVYRYTLIILFVIMGIIILFGNGFTFLLMMSEKSLRRKRNSFLASLILSDILYSVTFIPLFAIELGIPSKNCKIRSWRVLTFAFLFFTRILCVFLISVQTYIKTIKLLSKTDVLFEKYSHFINLVLIWLVPILVVITIATTPVQTNIKLGALTLSCFIVTTFIIIICYVVVLYGIKKANKRSASNAYDEGFKYVRLILISFLISSIPLAVCGIILVSFNQFESINHVLTPNQVYGVALIITSIASVINLFVYFKNLKDLNKTFLQFCFKMAKINSSQNNATTAGNSAAIIEEGKINECFYSQE